MGMRRRARETALQVLYILDVQPEIGADAALGRFFSNFDGDAGNSDLGSAPSVPAVGLEVRTFAERLVRGVESHLAEIDAQIVAASRNWRLERMARVDRNLLRLAVFEMKFSTDVPAKAAINEAIEIAKRFGSNDTAAFVNGILDRVLGGRGGG